MNFQEVVAIQVTLQGIMEVLNGLQNLTREMNNIEAAANRMTKAGAAFIAVGLAMSAVALKAYDSFVRFRMSIEAILGPNLGLKFANQLQAFSVPSAYDPVTLRKLGLQLAVNNPTDRAMQIIKSSTDLSAVGGADNDAFGRIAYALGQISNAGKVQGDDVRRQIMDATGGGYLIQAVLKQLGLRSPDQLYGMNSEKFFDAMIKAGNAPNNLGAQNRLAQNSPIVAIENTFQAFQNSLIKTGAIIAVLIYWFSQIVQVAIGLFNALNNLTGGWLGVALIVWSIYRGFVLLLPFLRAVATGLGVKTGALGRATTALNLFTIALQRASGAAVVGGAGSGIGGAAGGAAAGALGPRILGWLKDLWLTIQTKFVMVIASIADLLRNVFVGLIGKILLVASVFALLYYLIIKLIELVGGAPGGNPDEAFGTGKNWKKRFHDWLPDWMVGPPETAKTPQAADRPQRRSSWENVYGRRMGNVMKG